ncbi:protein-L-isoaspartate O-methyltransferase [Sphingomonas sp. ASV193]|uniref:protein-L-isoaspartate O-methyltransferase family protein n=1 Tax=Sphingomonas sp. ASV193 TaxID=3144405 RepID=UPI0032E8C479
MQDFQLARRAMIDSQLRPEAVTDAGVLEAMGAVAREDHVPDNARAFAYFDRPIPLDNGRSIMPPAALGRLLSELAPRAGERALVVEPASGYPAALLRHIGLTVDEGEGQGPYDLVLVDGAVEEWPASLTALLAEHGRVGTALLDRDVTRLAVGTRAGAGIAFRTIADAGVAPIARFRRAPAFTF